MKRMLGGLSLNDKIRMLRPFPEHRDHSILEAWWEDILFYFKCSCGVTISYTHQPVDVAVHIKRTHFDEDTGAWVTIHHAHACRFSKGCVCFN